MVSIYDRHTQKNAIDFVGHVIEKSLFRIHTNGKIERSPRTDQKESYQLLTYTDDVELNKKLEKWEKIYTFDRQRSSLNGLTHYEILREKLSEAKVDPTK